MSAPTVAYSLGAGLVCGLLAFWLTGTFHWAYLAAVASILWLATRTGGSRADPPSPWGPPTSAPPSDGSPPRA